MHCAQRDALPFLVHPQTNLQGGYYQDPPFIEEETHDTEQSKGRQLAVGWNFTPWKQAVNYYWDKSQRGSMESHLCRHWEEQCRPGKLATVFCKEMTHAPPQLPPSRSNSQSWPPVTPDAPPLSCRWAYLPSLRTGQAKSLSLSEVDGTNLNADIKAKIVFNRQIKFFFCFAG